MKITNYTEWLFFHLWKKNPNTGKCCPSVLLPDTVLYRWAQPFTWYFMTNSGIKRKKRTKITLDELERILNNNDFEKDISAIHLFKLKGGDREVIGLEHLSKIGLSSFI